MKTNLKKLNNDIINSLKNELKTKYQDFLGIYLFGSIARGEEHSYSDIDLAIVFDRVIDWRFQSEIWEIISLSEIEFGVFIDAHIINYKDIVDPNSPLNENIKTQGIFYGV